MSRLEDLLRRAAETAPNRPAVVEPGAGELSYAQLLSGARRYTADLEAAGVQPGDRVGLAAPKSLAAIEAIYGILLAGATYVPVDPRSPLERNATIFNDCGVRAVLASRDLADAIAASLPGSFVPSLAHGSLDLLTTEEFRAPGDEQTAYILYTSGSTGLPKGVPLSHAAALSFVGWCSHTFDVGPSDRFSSHAPLHFDLSILDLYLCAASAGTLVLVDLELGRQPRRLAPLIAEQRITVWYSTPSILSILVQAGQLERHDASSLRYVLFAGEVFPLSQLRALTEAWPHPRYFNLYGPTETNVCTFHEAQIPIDPERTGSLPIGKPCSHVETRVFDREGRQVPAGQEGELCVRGAPVMNGYWNPLHDAEVYWPGGPGEARWYRTGDRVRESPDGYLFAGRWDRMVKRRGFRVELGEVEARLSRHPGLSEVAALAHEIPGGGLEVVAHLCWREGQRPSLLEFRRFCSEQLPSSMIPDRFVHAAQLPRTSTDKIDYRALAEAP